MLWDIIRDWFVMYIWGGTTSNHITSNGFLGFFYETGSMSSWEGTGTGEVMIKIGSMVDGGNDTIYEYMCLGDWLSTTSTIIVLIAICVALFLVVRYLFRLTSGLIRGH